MSVEKPKRKKKVLKAEKAVFSDLQGLLTKMKASLDKNEAEMGRPLPPEIQSVEFQVARLQDTLVAAEHECDTREAEP